MTALIDTLAAPRVVRLIALTILLAICWRAIARPWRSALLLDAALATLTIYRPWPILLTLAVVQIAYRWSPPLATMIGDLFDARFTGLTMAIIRWWLPGWSQPAAPSPTTGQTIIMSRSGVVPDAAGTGSKGAGPGSGDPVPTHRNQVEPAEPGLSEPPAELPSLRNLSRQDLIVMLAVQRKEDGDYLYSANAIVGFVGGRAADVKDIIAAVRGPKSVPSTPATVQRPRGGW